MRILIAGVTVALLLCSAVAIAASSGTVHSGSFQMEATLSKEQYIEGEPVLVVVKFTNISDKPCRFAEPGYYIFGGELLSVSMVDTEPVGTYSADSTIVLPKDYGWDYAPGESRTVARSVVQSDLGEGTYCIQVTYKSPTYLASVWQGQLVSPKLSFSVVKPPAKLEFASRTFLSIRNAFDKKPLERAKDFGSLKDPAKGGPFSAYAGFYEARAYRMVPNDNYVATMEEYLKSHADVPYYGIVALELMGRCYTYRKDYDAARKAYSRLPESYEKTWLLKHVDKASK